ncbi:MAG TPA: 4-oxalocrotonate tautomerase family protein [Firmicutes bacterium]|nr:4-oxalocrotonate tautomerase family protein [Bacillota bacterium]HHY99412.1 4-oxalocrotonate tautomerase family protein [Bacillota bacterium]
MPHISVDGPHLTREQKAELVREFTETASRVMKIPKEAFVVMIKENDPENVGVGGKLLADRER